MEGATDSWFLEMNVGDELIGLAVLDQLDDGLSAIYTMFNPDHDQRSLGTLAILWQVREARERGLPWVYLGYWIRESRKMNYKTRYRPIEALIDGTWQEFDPDSGPS